MGRDDLQTVRRFKGGCRTYKRGWTIYDGYLWSVGEPIEGNGGSTDR